MASDHSLLMRLLAGDAERWRRRARFYELHRNYFPRLSSGRFVARCRELETMYRTLSWTLRSLARQAEWAWSGSLVSWRFAPSIPTNHPLPVTVPRPVIRKRQIRR